MIKKYCLASKMIMDFSGNAYVAIRIYAVAQKILPMIMDMGNNIKSF